MRRLHFERAIFRPQVDRAEDSGYTTLVHHFRRLWSGNVELGVGILLPVSKEEWELAEESIVGIAEGSQSLWAGVSVEASLDRRDRVDEVVPVLKRVGIGFL